jgi:hypothetical protein
MPYTELPNRCAETNHLTLLKLDKPSLVAINGIYFLYIVFDMQVFILGQILPKL